MSSLAPAPEQRKRTTTFVRTVSPSSFQFTQRDCEIVRWVYELRFVTANQIQRLCFSDKPRATSHCQARLQLLYHHGYLGRIPKPTSGLGAPVVVYCLDRKGRNLIAELQGVPRVEVAWERYDNNRGVLFLEHTLALNDLRINLLLASQAAGHTLTHWLSERTLKQKTAKEVVQDPRGSGKIHLVPDGWGQLLLASGQRFSFCVELDRGTQDIEQYKRKVRGYLAYFESGAYEKRYQTKSLTVLTVVATRNEASDARRVAQLLTWTNAEREVGRADTFEDLFYVTTLPNATPSAILVEPIWNVAGKDDIFSLIE